MGRSPKRNTFDVICTIRLNIDRINEHHLCYIKLRLDVEFNFVHF